MEKIIRNHQVVIFSKTYCPYSVRMKNLLEKYNIKNQIVMELNLQPEMHVMQAFTKASFSEIFLATNMSNCLNHPSSMLFPNDVLKRILIYLKSTYWLTITEQISVESTMLHKLKTEREFNFYEIEISTKFPTLWKSQVGSIANNRFVTMTPRYAFNIIILTYDYLKRKSGGIRTVPQLYVDGKFIGGFDTVKRKEMSGELAKIFTGAGITPKKSLLPRKGKC
ncbi:hypothetical protein X798_05688 [Onchocerca flexuosa]|uniref:Glutaredoxin domain-containing protein n=1 Tax=Onchocerca flexuosa TaxID=387005 RepID=A0A238BQ00_9BILA|nr:hypothetical protein X798_05688 [Onchocerca flexuosa]